MSLVKYAPDDQKFPALNYDSGNYIRRAQIDIASADIKLLNTTPYVLSDLTPPTGSYVIPIRLSALMDYDTAAYTGGGAVFLRWTGTTDNAASILQALVQASSDQFDTSEVVKIADIPISTGMELWAGVADFAAGSGILKLELEYRFLTFV